MTSALSYLIEDYVTVDVEEKITKVVEEKSDVVVKGIPNDYVEISYPEWHAEFSFIGIHEGIPMEDIIHEIGGEESLYFDYDEFSSIKKPEMEAEMKKMAIRVKVHKTITKAAGFLGKGLKNLLP